MKIFGLDYDGSYRVFELRIKEVVDLLNDMDDTCRYSTDKKFLQKMKDKVLNDE